MKDLGPKLLLSQQSFTVLKWSLVLILTLGTVFATGSTTIARNRCKDRCNDRYHLRKDACRAIPLKYERHRCEDAAKHAKNSCKRDCR